MSRTILLTGATGFIGCAVQREALRRGHRVVALARTPSSVTIQHENLHVIKATLQDVPWDKVREFQPDACVHSAWISTPGVYLDSPLNREFVTWSLGFLGGALGAGIEHVTALGTCIEYANTGRTMAEDSPLGPVSLYARCKNELREEIESKLVSDGLKLAWARIFYPYGPGEHPGRLSSGIIDKLSRKEEVLLKTPLSIKDFIYIDDVASAIVAIAEKRYSGSINVGTGQGIPVLEMAKTLGAIMKAPELIKAASPPAPDAYDFVVAGSSRLRALGWEPAVPLETGLRRLAECLTGRQMN